MLSLCPCTTAVGDVGSPEFVRQLPKLFVVWRRDGLYSTVLGDREILSLTSLRNRFPHLFGACKAAALYCVYDHSFLDRFSGSDGSILLVWIVLVWWRITNQEDDLGGA